MPCSSRLSGCVCPSCLRFYYDPETCEIVWQCGGCGPYDPYAYGGTEGYYFTLRSTTPTHDYGPVKPRGRRPGIPGATYTLLASAPGCKGIEYVLEVPAECACPSGCSGIMGGGGVSGGAGGLLSNLESGVATAHFYGFSDYVQTPVFTGGFGWSPSKCDEPVQYEVPLSLMNLSWSIPIKKGTYDPIYLGAPEGIPLYKTGCKFHYIEHDLVLDVGDFTTRAIFKPGHADETISTCTFHLQLQIHPVGLIYPSGSLTQIGAGVRIVRTRVSNSIQQVPPAYFCGAGPFVDRNIYPPGYSAIGAVVDDTVGHDWNGSCWGGTFASGGVLQSSVFQNALPGWCELFYTDGSGTTRAHRPADVTMNFGVTGGTGFDWGCGVWEALWV